MKLNCPQRTKLLTLLAFISIGMGLMPHARGRTLSCQQLFSSGINNARNAGGQFLHQKYPTLHTSRHIEKSARRNQTTPSNSPASKLDTWLEYLEKVIQRYSNHSYSKERFKKLFINAHITKLSEVSEGFYNLQLKIAREQGHGNIELTAARRKNLAETALRDQKQPLEAWLDYFLSKDSSSYPVWTKYWALMSLVRLGEFNPEAGFFGNRSRGQVTKFPELNREAFAVVIDAIVKKTNKKSLEDISDAIFLKLIERESFGKLYGRALQLTNLTHADLSSHQGRWVVYPQNSDPAPLVTSLQGQNTGWCTAGFETAKAQLRAGDFHVFYSLDKHGNPTVPRIAIRMESQKIAEIRGVAKGQHLDSVIAESPALKEKLQEFGNESQSYFKKVSDMKRLTEIENKHKNQIDLSQEDLSFLYEMNKPIEGFGYDKDPRINEIIDFRNIKEDVAFVLNIKPSEVSLTKNEALRGGIKYHRGDLDLSRLTSTEGLKLPDSIIGDLDLSSLRSAKGLRLPNSIRGNLDLSSLSSAEGLNLPNSIGRTLYLRSLTSAEGLRLPDSIGGTLYLSGLTSAKGLRLPNSIRGDLDLASVSSAEGLKLPDSIGGTLYLSGLTFAKGLKLPNSIGRNLYLSNLTSAEGLKLPDSIGGTLYLPGLTFAKGLKLPNSIGGTLYLNNLISAEGLKLPDSIRGNLNLSSLTSTEGLKLPNSIGGSLDLSSLTTARGLKLPDSIGGSLFLLGLTSASAEGLKLPDYIGGLVIGSFKQKN